MNSTKFLIIVIASILAVIVQFGGSFLAYGYAAQTPINWVVVGVIMIIWVILSIVVKTLEGFWVQEKN